MSEKNLLKILREESSNFRKVNYLLMNGVNILGDNMLSEYVFIEEHFEQLAEYYSILGYSLEKQENYFYLRVKIKDRYSSISYFSKSETFTGMYLALKFFSNLENPTHSSETIFEELKTIFTLENLYEIYVRKTTNFIESDRRIDTIMENFYKTLKQLSSYNFIEVKKGAFLKGDSTVFEIKKPIKRFFDLALELYDKDTGEPDISDILGVFIKETDFTISEEEIE